MKLLLFIRDWIILLVLVPVLVILSILCSLVDKLYIYFYERKSN